MLALYKLHAVLKVSRVPPGLRPGCSFHGHGVKRKGPGSSSIKALSDTMTARMLSTADTSIIDDLSILLHQPGPVASQQDFRLWGGGTPPDC